jgi:RNA polymerase sigma factor
LKLLEKKDTSRDKIIFEHKDFIYKYTCQICKKKLDWENDDQLSVALIAFNEALDKFDPERDKSFLGYAKLVIKNRLIDYFRKESRYKNLYLDDKNEDSEEHPLEIKAAWDSYRDELERRDRAYEMSRFEELVGDFGISFSDLVENCPNHKNTRDNLRQIALEVSQDDKIISKLYRTKKLPIKEIKKLTGTSRKILETWRKYLISLIVILTTDELTSLKEYVYPERRGNNEKS